MEFVIECRHIPVTGDLLRSSFVFSKIQKWDGEVKAVEALSKKDARIYSSIGRAQQGIRVLEGKLSDPYRMKVIPLEEAKFFFN